MYFLTEEERQKLVRGLLPKSRELEISDDLRGWNWNRPPLEAIYDESLAVYEIAGKYCKTARDLYLRKVVGVKTKWNQAMLRGSVLHETLAELLIKAKKLIYLNGVADYQKVIKQLKQREYQALEKREKQMDEKFYSCLKKELEIMWDFVYNQLVFRMQDLLAKQPYIGVDSLVNLAIPIIVEQKLDGSFLGLSKYLSADAFNFTEPMILDMKFGRKKEFHKLTVTAYAMVMESIFSFPISTGCIIYPKFKDDKLIVEKEFMIINDELRQWFIEERDEKMRLVAEEIDPGVGDDCYKSCPYHDECY